MIAQEPRAIAEAYRAKMLAVDRAVSSKARRVDARYVAIVLGLFFVPFLVADLGQSPLIAAAMVLAGIVAMRIALSRR